MASVFEAVRTGSSEREGSIAMANAIAAYGNAAVETVEVLAQPRRSRRSRRRA
jgi:hypothetical protein